MYSLQVGDNEYKLAEDYPLDKWLKIYKYSLDMKSVLSLGMGITLDDQQHMPEQTKLLASALIFSSMTPNWVPIQTKVKEGKLIDFNSLSFGKFIDLEVYLSNYYNKYPEIVKALYNIESIDGVTINQVYAGVESYLTWRGWLYRQYKNLFNYDDENEEENEVKQNKTSNIHLWYDLVMTLANDEFKNQDYVLAKPVIECFNWLAWHKDKLRKEAEAIRQTQR
jgi:hypothetical protein